MPKKKNYRPIMALVALAVAAMVAATFTFTNVTYWSINATKPPISVDQGSDATTPPSSDYIHVGNEYDPTTGKNITRISIVGFKGAATDFSSVLKLCNRYGSGPMQVRLVWVGLVGSTPYTSYIRAFYAKAPGGQKVGFEGSTTHSSAGPYTIAPGNCIDIGAHVAIDANLPDSAANGRTILGTYQIDIEISLS